MKDTLICKGMTFWGYHGCAPEEAVLGQKFTVDLEMEYEMGQDIATDKLSGFGYVEAYQTTKRIVTEERYNLIQKLAERIAEEILKLKPTGKCTVTIIKPGAPAGGAMEYAAVRIVREGPAY
ncbi:MAG TPA: dihydroneopterin aldolase [Bacillota bacterium]